MARRRRNHGQRVDAGTLAIEAISRAVPSDRLRITRVQIEWPALVDERLAEVTWPHAISGEHLTVLVADNQWLHEFGYVRADVLARIEARFGRMGIRSVRARVGRIPPPMPVVRPERIEAPPALSAEPAQETVGALRTIEDKTLRMAAATARLALARRR